MAEPQKHKWNANVDYLVLFDYDEPKQSEMYPNQYSWNGKINGVDSYINLTATLVGELQSLEAQKGSTFSIKKNRIHEYK